MIATKPLGLIEHVVVLMFENRSFDNMLGGLYPHGPKFDGVPPGYSIPENPDDPDSLKFPVFQASADEDARIIPFPDPNEDFNDIAEQICDGTMWGFIHNYAKAIKDYSDCWRDLPKRIRDIAQSRNIMQYYKPGPQGYIPVTSCLASTYAVSDRYFGSGPVQTWPSRLFAHCGTPGWHLENNKQYAYLNNVDYPNYHDCDPFRGQLSYKTIFELLDEKHTDKSRKAWKVYYNGEVPISAFLKYVHDRWYWAWEDDGNVYEYANFAHDVRSGTLPTYSFIEPRY